MAERRNDAVNRLVAAAQRLKGALQNNGRWSRCEPEAAPCRSLRSIRPQPVARPAS